MLNILSKACNQSRQPKRSIINEDIYISNKWPLLFCPESEEVRWSPYIVHRLTSARRTRHYHPGIPKTVWSRLLTNACNIMGLIYLLIPRDFFHERKMQSKHYRFFYRYGWDSTTPQQQHCIYKVHRSVASDCTTDSINAMVNQTPDESERDWARSFLPLRLKEKDMVCIRAPKCRIYIFVCPSLKSFLINSHI